MNQYGEFLPEKTAVDQIKDNISDVVHVIRNADEYLQPLKREKVWKEELKRRKDEEELKMGTSESVQNYQRKVLPWEEVEVIYMPVKCGVV